MVSCRPLKIPLPVARIVLIFCIAGLLFFVPRARRTLGAYRIPRETGLLIPSDKRRNLRSGSTRGYILNLFRVVLGRVSSRKPHSLANFFLLLSACPFGQLPPLPLCPVISCRIITDSFMRPPPLLLTMKLTDAVSVWLVFHEDCWLLLLGRFCPTFSGRVFLSISREPSNASQRFRRLRSGTR